MTEEKYKSDLNKAHEDSVLLINPKSEYKIAFLLKESISTKKVFGFFDKFPKDISIEVFDNKKYEEKLKAVQEKYKNFLSKNPKIRITMCAPSYVDTVISQIAFVGIFFLFPWMVSNIINDINNKLWGKVKSSFKSVFYFFYKKEKDKNIGVTFRMDSWHIIFIFDLRLEKSIIINGFDSIPSVLKLIKEGKYHFLSLVFKLDRKTGKWKQTNTKYLR